MHTAEYYRESLHLTSHPEGGAFVQTYLEENGAYSSILFLLEAGEVSRFHQLQEDELWYFQDGAVLTIYEILPGGALQIIRLGRDAAAGQKLQHLVRKGSIFASRAEGGAFTLVGCMVCPAFTYEHFKLWTKEELTALYPAHAALAAELAV